MLDNKIPSFAHRLLSVWFRHLRIYTRNVISNAISPLVDPLLFILGVGIGLGAYVGAIDTPATGNLPFLTFLASGIAISTSMFTATFECTYATFIRLDFDKVYDGMLGAPLSAYNILLGELLWAGSKGIIFCLGVALVCFLFGLLPPIMLILAPLIGFFSGMLFGSLGFLVTSFIKTINHFSILFTALLTPMFMFCGVFFPIETLPSTLRPLTEILPLTHPVRLARALAFGGSYSMVIWDIAYCLLFVSIVGGWGIIRLRRRLID